MVPPKPNNLQRPYDPAEPGRLCARRDCGVDGELIGATRLGQKALLKTNCVQICRGHFNREFGFNVG